MDTTKSIGIQGKISPARTERQNSAFENYLIRFFERELEVKLTRREMWRNISFFARSLAFLEKNPHLCNAHHLNQATTFANFAVGIFYAQGDIYSSDPRVESLMASQPDLGDEQRESGTFLFPSRVLVNILFHLMLIKMKRTVALPVSQAKEGRKTSALEKSLIRFFERELEVKLTRREMWQSVRFVASLFVLLLALSTGEPLPVLPALALAAYAYRGVTDITSRFTEKGGAR